MPTSAQLLTLVQMLSPTYPVGAFAYSHGLEWAIEAGDVCHRVDLEDWVADVLEHGSGRTDALFLAAAYHAQNKDSLHQTDAMCRAFCASQERLKETDLQGAAFCATTGRVWQVDLQGLTYPVSVGRAIRLLDLPAKLAAQMYLHSFMSNLVTVGMRLMPLGQTDGQSVIRTLTPLCCTIAQDTGHGDLDTLTSTAFLADIASMRHETQYTRIFRT